eukprot:COSAG04_NODE_5138_length_1723_cov_1.774631_1_plen_131_part_10
MPKSPLKPAAESKKSPRSSGAAAKSQPKSLPQRPPKSPPQPSAAKTPGPKRPAPADNQTSADGPNKAAKTLAASPKAAASNRFPEKLTPLQQRAKGWFAQPKSEPDKPKAEPDKPKAEPDKRKAEHEPSQE